MEIHACNLFRVWAPQARLRQRTPALVVLNQHPIFINQISLCLLWQHPHVHNLHRSYRQQLHQRSVSAALKLRRSTRKHRNLQLPNCHHCLQNSRCPENYLTRTSLQAGDPPQRIPEPSRPTIRGHESAVPWSRYRLYLVEWRTFSGKLLHSQKSHRHQNQYSPQATEIRQPRCFVRLHSCSQRA